MNRTDTEIAACCDVDSLRALRGAVELYDIPPAKNKRFLKAIAHRRLEIELALADGEQALPGINRDPTVCRNVTQKPRWRKITKFDGEGNLLLVGYERRSRLSRKAGETRWLKTPKLLQAVVKKEPA